jgi:hypothetical protein
MAGIFSFKKKYAGKYKCSITEEVNKSLSDKCKFIQASSSFSFSTAFNRI